MTGRPRLTIKAALCLRPVLVPTDDTREILAFAQQGLVQI